MKSEVIIRNLQSESIQRLKALYPTARGSAPGKHPLTPAAPCKGKSNGHQIMPLQGARPDDNLYPGCYPGLSRYKASSLAIRYHAQILDSCAITPHGISTLAY